MTQPHHRNRHTKYRKKYKIHNWRAYERSLINRGDLTLWLSEDVIESCDSDLTQTLGRPKLYSDLAIFTYETKPHRSRNFKLHCRNVFIVW